MQQKYVLRLYDTDLLTFSLSEHGIEGLKAEILLPQRKIGKGGMEEEIGNHKGAMLQFAHEGLHLMGDIFHRVGQLA